MFSTLRSQKSSVNQEDSLQIISDITIESLTTSFEVKELLRDIKSMQTTVSDLSALYTIIETHGLSPTLLKFANMNNQLSNAIPTIPSLESLTNNFTNTDRDAALEGIVTAIGDLIKKIVDKIKSVASRIISKRRLRQKSIEEVRKQLTHYKSIVQDKTFVDNTNNRMKLIRKQTLFEMIELVTNLCPISAELFSLTLPESYDTYKTTFEQDVVNVIKKHIHDSTIFYNGHFAIMKPITASLREMGYDETAFHEICEKLETFITSEFSDTAKWETEYNTFNNKVQNRLIDLSVTVRNNETGTYVTHYTDAANVLSKAYNLITHYIDKINDDGWKYGIVQGLNTLRYMSKLYQ